MASYDATPTLSQTISAGLNYANNIIGIGLDIQKEKARSDLLHMQAQYDTDQNDFLTKLSNEADYQKYEEYYLKFVNNIGNQFTNKDSPYYCDNSFTQKKANEMLESQKVALRNKVSEMMNTKAMQDIMATDKETARQNRTNLSAPEATKANSALYTNWFSHGWIDRDTYNNLLLSEQTLTYNAAIDSLYNSNVDAAIASGLTGKEFWDQIEKNHPELNDLEVNVISTGMANPENAASGNGVTAVKMSPDSERYKAIKNNFLQNYDASVASMQEKNETKLSEMYSTLATLEDPLQQLNYCRNALNVIKTQMQGNRMNATKRNNYVNMFSNYLDSLVKAAKSGTSASNLDDYSDMVKNIPETVAAKLERGEIKDFYAAKDAVDIQLRDVYYSRDFWKETKNMTQEEKDKYFNENYSRNGAIQFLQSETLMKYLNTPQYAEIKTKYDKAYKDITADIAAHPDPKNRKYSENALGILGSFAADFIAQNGKGVLSPEAIDNFSQFLNNVSLDQLDKSFSNFNNKSEKGIINGVNAVWNNDVLFTNLQNEEVFASPQAQKYVEEIAAQHKDIIADNLNIDGSKLQQHGYLKVENDEKPVAVYEYKGADGKVNYYHLEPAENGKSYTVVDQDGKTYGHKTDKEKRAAYNEDKTTSAGNIKDANKSTKQLKEEREEEVKQMSYADFKTRVQNNKSLTQQQKDKLINYYFPQEDWGSIDPTAKVNLMEKHGFFNK